MEPVRVFVGTDRSQLLAVKVLAHSIRRHTDLAVEVTPMCDLPTPIPRDPRQRQRTGFSFSRFCIPALAGYRGRAIYMDADMLVRKDIRELWTMDFGGAKIVIQEELTPQQSAPKKENAPIKRKKQCAVMLLDCARLDWKIEDIVQGLDENRYTYTELMHDMCLLSEDEINYGLPFRWNSLEHLDETTCLIHYTDMGTQPWVSPFNDNAEIWYEEVRLMLANGSITWAEIENEIEMGFFRPSLARDIAWGSFLPGILNNALRELDAFTDKRRGYRKHAKVYAMKAERDSLGPST